MRAFAVCGMSAQFHIFPIRMEMWLVRCVGAVSNYLSIFIGINPIISTEHAQINLTKV